LCLGDLPLDVAVKAPRLELLPVARRHRVFEPQIEPHLVIFGDRRHNRPLDRKTQPLAPDRILREAAGFPCRSVEQGRVILTFRVGIDFDPALLERQLARVERAGLAGRIRGVKWNPADCRFADTLFGVVSSAGGPARTEHFIANRRQRVLVLARGEPRPGHLKAAKAP
jgi:hypothetical protein